MLGRLLDRKVLCRQLSPVDNGLDDPERRHDGDVLEDGVFDDVRRVFGRLGDGRPGVGVDDDDVDGAEGLVDTALSPGGHRSSHPSLKKRIEISN